MSSITQKNDVPVFRAKCWERGAGDNGKVDKALGRGFSDLKYYIHSVSSITFYHVLGSEVFLMNLQ